MHQLRPHNTTLPTTTIQYVSAKYDFIRWSDRYNVFDYQPKFSVKRNESEIRPYTFFHQLRPYKPTLRTTAIQAVSANYDLLNRLYEPRPYKPLPPTTTLFDGGIDIPYCFEEIVHFHFWTQAVSIMRTDQ